MSVIAGLAGLLVAWAGAAAGALAGAGNRPDGT
jgi:hypothetical protein